MIGKFGRKRSTPTHPLKASYAIDWTRGDPIVRVIFDSGIRLNGPCHYLELELSVDDAKRMAQTIIEKVDDAVLVMRADRLEDLIAERTP